MPEFLTDRDHQLIQRVISQVLRESRNPRLRPVQVPEVGQAQQVRIVRTPAGGIPGSYTDRNRISFADCDVYELVQSGDAYELLPAGFTEQVFNLSSNAIDGLAHVKITQDIDGWWWADCGGCEGPDEVFTGTGTGTEGDGGGGGEEVTVCCPNDAIPDVIYATIVPAFGQCTCAEGAVSIALIFDGVSKWIGTGPLGTCGPNVTLTFYCEVDTVFRLNISFSDFCHAEINNLTPSVSTCNPLSATFTAGVGFGACGCDGAGSISYIITA